MEEHMERIISRCKQYIDTLAQTQMLTEEELIFLIDHRCDEVSDYLFHQAREIRHLHYGHDIYIRGLIEFTNHCKNDCFYCGIRKSNLSVPRYRLSKEQILACCEEGYHLGFRTFVLQGGEDLYFTQARITDIVQSIKSQFPDCAVTLSIGEWEKESYEAFFHAGADRYLLRHETYDSKHYSKLHPTTLDATHRQNCLWNLKEIGFQTGTGFMVGSPYQTSWHLAQDLLFLKQLNPHMVGIGPFIHHHETPFKDMLSGSLDLTLFLLGLIRLLLPKVLLPATTALGSIHPTGRELGILAGANVVMPNLSPSSVRKDYSLYDNKLYSKEESAQSILDLRNRMDSIGYQIVTARGDSLNIN